MKVLIVEDSEAKLTAIKGVLEATRCVVSVFTARTVVEAERAIEAQRWDFLILDISLDIAPSKLGPRSRGSANIGGLAIAQKMFLLECEVPTVIITAFDSFTTPGPGQSKGEILGFDEVKARAEKFLPGALRATLQYADPNWRSRLADIVREVAAL